VINIRTEGRNGDVVGVKPRAQGDEVLFITQTGMLVRTPVAEISTMGRNTQGVRLVNLKEGDRLVSLEIVSEQEPREVRGRGARDAAGTPRRAVVRGRERRARALEDGDDVEAGDEGADDADESADEASESED
jgi:DNA gyrase/topoisomerase IV subunit A